MRLIDADVLKEIIEYQQIINPKLSVYDVIKLINNAPTVELQMGRMTNGIIIPIERPTGEWNQKCDDNFDWYECSCCGYGNEGELQERPWFKFCPCCGAKMKGTEE